MRTGIACIAAAAVMALSALPASGEDAAKTYSEEEVSDFVDLLLTAAEIDNEALAGIDTAASEEEAYRIHLTATQDILNAIETSPLGVEDYDDIVASVKTDMRVAMQVYDEIERRGEVVMLPEPWSAPDFSEDVMGESTPVRHAVDGEAGF